MASCGRIVGRPMPGGSRPTASVTRGWLALLTGALFVFAAATATAQESISIVSPAFAETFVVGTSDVTLVVEVTGHTGSWQYLVDASFATSGAGGGSEVSSGVTATLSGLSAGVHTVSVALVDDAGDVLTTASSATSTFLIGGELHEFDYSVPEGLSLFSAALEPYGVTTSDAAVSLVTSGVMRASHLIRLGSTVVISLQGGVFQTAVGHDGYIQFGDNFDIEPGHGYVVNFVDPVYFTMLGTPHGVSVGDATAAPGMEPAHWAFALAGNVPDMDLLPAGVTMRVRNLDTRKTVPAVVTDDGRYIASFVDANRRRVVAEGDLVQFEFVTADGYVLGSRVQRRLTAEDMRLASLAVNFSTRPAGARLLPNYPNPFNPETWMPFELADPSDVTIRVYGLGGEFVRQIDVGQREAGYHVARDAAAYWDGRNATGETVAGGVYLYELVAGSRRDVRRLTILK